MEVRRIYSPHPLCDPVPVEDRAAYLQGGGQSRPPDIGHIKTVQ